MNSPDGDRAATMVGEVPARSGRAIGFTIVVTIVTMLLGLLAFHALELVLGTPEAPGPHEPPPMSASERLWFFAVIFAVFLFFLRTATIAIIKVVTTRAPRAALVPWWFAVLFVAALGVLALVSTVEGLRHGNAWVLLDAGRALVFAVTLAIPIRLLRRTQAKR